MEVYNNSTVAITGGTGSFGSTFLRKLLGNSDVKEIRIISRDETKQDDLRLRIKDHRVKFFLCDVRDSISVVKSLKKVDFVFHAAALKQVPSNEFFPVEAIKTNVLGSCNVLEAAISNEVKGVVALSTDKAAYPVNSMGMTKALMEKIVQSMSREGISGSTNLMVTRYGNVLMSRGSVIPRLMEQVIKGFPMKITNPNMTRFLMSLDDSIDLVTFALKNGQKGDLFVKKSKGANLLELASGVALALGYENHPIDVVGIRHGEKMHETLLGSEDMRRAQNLEDFFCVPLDVRNLDYSELDVANREVSNLEGNPESYTSSSTIQLNREEVANALKTNPEFNILKNQLASTIR